jgi:hypothetical protein
VFYAVVGARLFNPDGEGSYYNLADWREGSGVYANACHQEVRLSVHEAHG